MSTNQGFIFDLHLLRSPGIEAELARVTALYGAVRATSIDIQLWTRRPIAPQPRNMPAFQFPRMPPTVTSYVLSLPPDEPGDYYWYTKTISLLNLQPFAMCAMEIQLGMRGVGQYRTPVNFQVMIDAGSYPCWLFSNRLPFLLPGPGNLGRRPKLYMTNDPNGTGRLKVPPRSQYYEYFGGSKIWTEEYVDVLRLKHPDGSTIQSPFSFGAVVQASNHVLTSDFDGIWGFGFSDNLNTNLQSTPNSFFDDLIINRTIASPQMAMSMSTVEGKSRMCLGIPPLEWTREFTLPVPLRSVPGAPNGWIVDSPSCRINGRFVRGRNSGAAAIDTGSSMLCLDPTVVSQFYAAIPQQYVVVPTGARGVYGLRNDTPLACIPALEVAIGPDFLFIHPEAIMQVERAIEIASTHQVGLIQSRDIVYCPFDILGTPALVCMIAKFRKGPDHGQVRRETATFSFRKKHPRE